MTTTLAYTVLGTSDFTSWTVDVAQLPNGQLFALNYKQDDTTDVTSKIEFLSPSANGITDVTASVLSGPAPSGIGSVNLIDQLPVGGNALPDIVLTDGGLDQAPWLGGQVRILAPNADGQYVDETSALPQVDAFNHRLSVGTIDGQAAIAVAQIGNQSNLPYGVELIIANTDGTFTDWTSHIPASVQHANVYTYDAISDFTGHGGDIFLGSENATVDPSVILVNDGSGNFTAMNVTVPVPQLFKTGELDHNGYPTQMPVVYAMPTKFQGDSHEDIIVVYANSAAASYGGSDTTEQGYYLQFLQGDGKGGFTDVTTQHLAAQPTVLNSYGDNAWIVSIQQVVINGENDLILYAASGGATILLNNGQDVYSPSPVQMTQNVYASTWGTNAGIGGFFGYTSGEWTFTPVTVARLAQTSAVIDDPLASHVYLYGTAAGASLPQTFETTISLTLHGAYGANGNDAFSVLLDGKSIGGGTLTQTYAFTYQGGQYTSDQTFSFTVQGLTSIGSLQVTGNAASELFVSGATIGATVLSTINQWSNGGATDTLDASPWNTAYSANLGTAEDPIQVTGSGTGVTVHVLGDHTQYSETGIGTATIHLSESAGLDQNAVLTDISYIVFQDGAVLNTVTGAWASTSATVTAAQASSQPGYVSTVNVADSAANVSASLDSLEPLASAGTLGTITLSDGGLPTLTLTTAQLTADAAALKAIGGYFNLDVTAPSSSADIAGGAAGLGMTVTFGGASSGYSLTAAGDGHDLTVSNGTATFHLSGVTAVKFSDVTDIIASQTPAPGATVSSAQITELYGAVFGRLPDVGGLAYYQQSAAANPGMAFVQYAVSFLSSPEYANNPAHAYALNADGDAKFIADSYQNLLHRAPEAGAAAYYEANVINPIVAAETAAGLSLTQAELLAHAQVLANFSQSPEFLGDVQVTAQHPSSSSHWLLLV